MKQLLTLILLLATLPAAIRAQPDHPNLGIDALDALPPCTDAELRSALPLMLALTDLVNAAASLADDTEFLNASARFRRPVLEELAVTFIEVTATWNVSGTPCRQSTVIYLASVDYFHRVELLLWHGIDPFGLSPSLIQDALRAIIDGESEAAAAP